MSRLETNSAARPLVSIDMAEFFILSVNYNEVVVHFDFARCAVMVCNALGINPERIDGLDGYHVSSACAPFLQTKEDEEEMVKEDATTGGKRRNRNVRGTRVFSRAITPFLDLPGQSLLVCQGVDTLTGN